jgi:uncharacterized protein (TIGR01777 family)
LQSSTATIYAHSLDQPNGETGVIGGEERNTPATWQFSVDVAKAWEAAAREFESLPSRLVLMRTAMVMSPDRAGVLDVLLGLVRKGLGGKNASGRQYVSWIHEADFASSVRWLIEHESLTGPVNICAPHPLPNREFMAALRQAAGVRFGLPATKWMLELGAWWMDTETELVLKSRRVVPDKLSNSGFQFEYPAWPEAAKELYARWERQANSNPQQADL